jgi:hypothetical protein
MSHQCTTAKPVETERRKKAFNKEQRTTIEKMTAQRHRYMDALRKLGDTVQTEEMLVRSQRLAQIEDEMALTYGDMVKLDPSQHNKLESWLAAKLNWKRNALNPSTEFNAAGEVRNALVDTRRISENMLEDAGKYRMMSKLNDYTKTFERITKRYGVARDDLEELFNETLEVATIPKNNRVYGNSDGVRLLNGQRYNNYVEKVKALGLSDDDITTLRDIASEVHTSFDEVRLVAEATGHSIETLENLGYFPRIASRDFQLRLRKELTKDSALANTIMSEGVEEVKLLNPLGSVWQKSRKFNYTVPTDFAVAGKFLGMEASDVAELVGKPKEWVELMDSFSDSQVDALIDSGIMEKLPMTSREVFNYFVDNYELPYKNLNEMFKLDPAEAISTYISHLKKAVGNSAMLNTIAKDGLTAGWALTGKQLSDITPEFRSNFVPLKFQNIDEFLTPEQIQAASGVYVHRTVAAQWKSLLEISVNPVKLGNVARVWHYLSTFLNKSTLLARNVLYVGQNLMSGVVMSHAAGANLATLPHAMFDMFKYWSGGIDSFDAVKPFAKIEGNWLSKKEFFRNFMLRRGSDAVPGAANINSTSFRFESLDPRNTKRALEYMWSYADAFKDPIRGIQNTTEYFGSLANAANTEAFAPFAQMATFVDTMMKWNTAMSLVERSGSANIINNIAGALTLEPLTSVGRKFGTWKDLTRYVDEYFFTFDDPGTITRNVGKYIRPFAGWAMTSPPAMIRHLLRKPQKFLAYNRLLQLVNYNNDGDVPQAGLTDWQDDEYMVSLRHDVMSGGGIIALFPSGYDPIVDSVSFLNNADGLIKTLAFGTGGNERDKRKRLAGQDGVQQVLSDLFNTSYYAKPFSVLTGVDSFTGEKRDTTKRNVYLGVPMSQLAEALLGMYAPLDSLNRNNPGNLLGRKEYRDAFGNIVVPSQPAVTGYERTNSDAVNLAWEKATPSEKLLMGLGAKVRIIDTARNIQMNLDELQYGLRDLMKSNVNEQHALSAAKGNLPTNDYNRRRKILAERIEAEYQLRTDFLRVQQYAQQNKIPVNRIFNELKKRQITVSDLPLEGNEQRLRLLNELDERINEVNK